LNYLELSFLGKGPVLNVNGSWTSIWIDLPQYRAKVRAWQAATKGIQARISRISRIRKTFQRKVAKAQGGRPQPKR
jgi:hypothetical protein